MSAAGSRGVRHGPAPVFATLAALGLLGTLATLGLSSARPATASAHLPAAWTTSGPHASATLMSASPASASPASASSADGISVAASALLSSPLYIDADMAWMFTPSAQSQIESALKASPVRVFLAAVPFGPDDDNVDYADYFLDQLYRRMHLAGVYLAVGPSGIVYDTEYLVPRDVTLPLSVEFGPDSDVEPSQIAADTPGRILRLLNVIATSPADPGAATAPPPVPAPSPLGAGPGGAPGSGSQPSAAGDLAWAGVLALVFLGPLLALSGFAVSGAGRRIAAGRRGWGDRGDPGIPAGRMPASPSTAWLLRHARGELDELERLIAPAGSQNQGWQRACDGYDAGRLSLNSGPEQIDLVGAIVLAREGRLALRWNTAEPPPPCVVNPLHGRSVRTIAADGRVAKRALAQLVRRTRLSEVPLCAGCSRRAARGQLADLARLAEGQLQVEHDGQRTPYFSFDSVWRDAAFGASGAGLPKAVREHLGVT